MNLIEEVFPVIGQNESLTLEYKAVLPPSRIIARLIAGMANSEGGFIVLGVSERNGDIEINGLSEDFHAKSVTNKAVDLLSPKPNELHDYIDYSGKRLFVIKVEKNQELVSIEGNIFIRQGEKTVLSNPELKQLKPSGIPRIKDISRKIDSINLISTGAKNLFLTHFQSVLNIIDDLKTILYPISSNEKTTINEGKILSRILFSSCADNFESYLSDLLNEIYLAFPNTLKSGEQVTIKEVLDCADIEDFISYWASKKLSKLQRGSVKGFLKGSKQIDDLGVIDTDKQKEIEKILQIRHLYAHRNGIVDDKFLKYVPTPFQINDEHQLSINELLDKLDYLIEIVHEIDKAAIEKYSLATLE